MDPSTWKKIETILDHILPLNRSEQTEYIEQHVDDPELKREINALLEAEKNAPPYLDEGVEAILTGEKMVHDIAESISETTFEIDRYRIEKEIGRGGMSVVYLAHRTDGEFDQKVAVKIIQPFGIDREDRFRRLRAERQILANLHHPNIAQVFDGGITTEGWPYMVMELVDGVPVNRYCKQNKLDLNTRLELFQKICDAVEYAHRNLVVHRDLKPGNILVTETGQVKLLDFGIAKLLTEDENFPVTQTGKPLMTPDYASPEQFKNQRITTSVDIYSLGVILYELLAGVRPFDLSGKSLREIERLVCDTEPLKPSLRMKSGNLDDDLDLICLKALRKEVENRYSSVQKIMEDIDRFQHGLPINVRPPTTRYRIRKFIQRHRQSTAIAILAAIILITIIAFYTWQLQNERDIARQEAQKAQRMTDFTTSLFTAADPWDELNAESLQVRDVLDRGAKQIQETLAAEPEIQASMMQAIAVIYKQLGLYDEALPLVNRALETRLELYGENHPEVAESMFEKGNILYGLGEYEASEANIQQAFNFWNTSNVKDYNSLAAGYNGLAMALEAKGEYDKADGMYSQALHMYEFLPDSHLKQKSTILRNQGLLKITLSETESADSLLHRAYEIRTAIFGEIHPYSAQSLRDLALLARHQANYDQAFEFAQSALEIYRTYLGINHPLTAGALNSLGLIQRERGNLHETEYLHREALSIYQNIFTNPHSNHAITLNYLGLALRKQGKLDEAENTYKEALAVSQEIWGDIHPNRAMILYNLGGISQAKGSYEESERYYREVLEIDRSWYGYDHFEVGIDLLKLASLLSEKGTFTEAENLFIEGLKIIEETLGPEHPRTAEGLANLANLLVKTDRFAEAENNYIKALQIQIASYGSSDTRTMETYKKIIHLYERWDKPEKVNEYRKMIASQ